METHKLDIRKSEAVFNSLRDEIMVKRCYNNINKVAIEYYDKTKNGIWKIAYGYLPFGNLRMRHCFIVDEEGNAIDPTMIAAREIAGVELPTEEYSFLLLNYDEYWELIENNNFYPDLHQLFQNVENELCKETDLFFVG